MKTFYLTILTVVLLIGCNANLEDDVPTTFVEENAVIPSIEQTVGNETRPANIGPMILSGVYVNELDKIALATAKNIYLLDDYKYSYHSWEVSSAIQSIDYAPDTNMLVSSHEDGFLRFWSLDDFHMIDSFMYNIISLSSPTKQLWAESP